MSTIQYLDGLLEFGVWAPVFYSPELFFDQRREGVLSSV